MMGHDICPLLHLLLLRMPCPERLVVVLLPPISTAAIAHASRRRRTSVKLTGTSLPTMLPTVDAFCRMLASISFASARFAATFASRSFFCATSSSAFSFACPAAHVRMT